MRLLAESLKNMFPHFKQNFSSGALNFLQIKHMSLFYPEPDAFEILSLLEGGSVSLLY